MSNMQLIRDSRDGMVYREGILDYDHHAAYLRSLGYEYLNLPCNCDGCDIDGHLPCCGWGHRTPAGRSEMLAINSREAPHAGGTAMMMPQTIPLVVVDGCAVPAHLYEQARSEAVASKATKYIGIIYDPPARLEPKVAPGLVGLIQSITTPPPLFSDLRNGKHLRYLMGCTYDELKTCKCAVILHISPLAEAAL